MQHILFVKQPVFISGQIVIIGLMMFPIYIEINYEGLQSEIKLHK